jgi:hypothetical protein
MTLEYLHFPQKKTNLLIWYTTANLCLRRLTSKAFSQYLASDILLLDINLADAMCHHLWGRVAKSQVYP